MRDALVIGAGFGGLGAALTLAEAGRDVVVCETLRYPGGCASTFAKDGHRFETGATLFAGLGEDGLFGRWLARHGLQVRVERPDPPVVLQGLGWALPVDADRGAFVERLCAWPGAPAPAIRRWFALQTRVADALWPVLSDPALLPPWSAEGWRRHLRRLPTYAGLLSLVGAPLGKVLRRYGLADFAPLRLWLDATCQITVQCPAGEAEALVALATADYFFRGAAHVHGGIGRLAEALCQAVESSGGEVRLANRVRQLTPLPDGAGWRVTTRRGTWEVRHVIANLLPGALRRLLGDPPSALERLERDVAGSWGACMRYLAVSPEVVSRPEAHHLELIGDPGRPLHDGNHVFCSISAADEHDRAPDDSRVITVSTHMTLPAEGLPKQADVEAVQSRMEAVMRARLPALMAGVRRSWSASPRTWERYTGRPHGRVGGVPRRAGLKPYLALLNPPLAPGLWLVGDSVFPGQSTVATALGGAKVAARVDARLGRRQGAAGPPLLTAEEVARGRR